MAIYNKFCIAHSRFADQLVCRALTKFNLHFYCCHLGAFACRIHIIGQLRHARSLPHIRALTVSCAARGVQKIERKEIFKVHRTVFEFACLKVQFSEQLRTPRTSLPYPILIMPRLHVLSHNVFGRKINKKTSEKWKMQFNSNCAREEGEVHESLFLCQADFTGRR